MSKTESTKRIIRAFLLLHNGCMPAASWVDDEDTSSCWNYLRDALREEEHQRYDHIDEPIRIRADADGWRDGVVVVC